MPKYRPQQVSQLTRGPCTPQPEGSPLASWSKLITFHSDVDQQGHRHSLDRNNLGSFLRWGADVDAGGLASSSRHLPCASPSNPCLPLGTRYEPPARQTTMKGRSTRSAAAWSLVAVTALTLGAKWRPGVGGWEGERGGLTGNCLVARHRTRTRGERGGS